MFRYYTFRIYPTQAQLRRLEAALEVCGSFYNMLLEELLAAHRAGQRLSRGDLQRRVAEIRRVDPGCAALHSHTLQLVTIHVDRAWRTWIRHGGKGKGPRPRAPGLTGSFGFKQFRNGFHIDGRRLRLFGIGRVAVRWHRPLQGQVKNLRSTRETGRWCAALGCELESTPLPRTGLDVGIDLGTDNLLTLSNGECIANPRWALAAQEQLARLRERLRRAVPGSEGECKARLDLGCAQVRVAARRRDFLSKLVARLVRSYDRLALENLPTARLASERAAISDAGWGLFRRLLVAKAQATGRTVSLVKAAYTSQICSACGMRARRYLPLSERHFSCSSCGYCAPRDVNSARVILRRGRELWGTL